MYHRSKFQCYRTLQRTGQEDERVSSLHIEKAKFTIPFVCRARNLGEALRRIKEGAAMIRTKGEAGTGDVSQAVLHMRMIQGQIRSLKGLDAATIPQAEALQTRGW